MQARLWWLQVLSSKKDEQVRLRDFRMSMSGDKLCGLGKRVTRQTGVEFHTRFLDKQLLF